MRDAFMFPDQRQDFWVPFPRDFNTVRESRFIQVVGRMRSGQSLAAVDAEVKAVARRLEEGYPVSQRGHVGSRQHPLR